MKKISDVIAATRNKVPAADTCVVLADGWMP